MFIIWDKYYNKLDAFVEKSKKIKENGSFIIMQKQLQKEVADYIFLEKNISRVFTLLNEKYKITKKELKNMFAPKSGIFSLSNDEIIKRFDYYICLFGSKELFYKTIRNETFIKFSPYASRNGLFDWDDMSNAENQLLFFEKFFNIDRECAVSFSAYNAYYFNSDCEFLESKVQEYAEVLGTNIDTIKKICLRYPYSFYSRVERLEEKIVGFGKSFNINYNDVKNMLLKFPPLIDTQITIMRKYVKVLSKQLKNVFDVVSEYPYILYLIDNKTNYFYKCFDDVQQIIDNFNSINKNIGTIEDVLIKYLENSYYVFAIVKKADNSYCLVTLGLKSSNINVDLTSEKKYKVCICGDYYNFIFNIKSYQDNHIKNKMSDIIKEIRLLQENL